jgi:integrase
MGGPGHDFCPRRAVAGKGPVPQRQRAEVRRGYCRCQGAARAAAAGRGLGDTLPSLKHPKKCNHSWRHTVKSRSRDFMEELYRDKLTGHSDATREGREYRRYPIPLLKKQIDAVEPWEIA